MTYLNKTCWLCAHSNGKCSGQCEYSTIPNSKFVDQYNHNDYVIHIEQKYNPSNTDIPQKKEIDINDIELNVIRLVQGTDTTSHHYIIKAKHKPTGINIEMPKQKRSEIIDRELIISMLTLAVNS